MEIIFGSFAPPLHKQLDVKQKLVEPEQMDADAVARLRIRGIITALDSRMAERRIVKALKEKLESVK